MGSAQLEWNKAPPVALLGIARQQGAVGTAGAEAKSPGHQLVVDQSSRKFVLPSLSVNSILRKVKPTSSSSSVSESLSWRLVDALSWSSSPVNLLTEATVASVSLIVW